MSGENTKPAKEKAAKPKPKPVEKSACEKCKYVEGSNSCKSCVEYKGAK